MKDTHLTFIWTKHFGQNFGKRIIKSAELSHKKKQILYINDKSFLVNKTASYIFVRYVKRNFMEIKLPSKNPFFLFVHCLQNFVIFEIHCSELCNFYVYLARLELA